MSYAVKVGRQPGIYTTWDLCRAQVDGYKGAIHKKFPTRAEAEAWLAPAGTTVESKAPVESKGPDVAGYTLWTDGSAVLGKSAGAGWAIALDGKVLHEGGVTLRSQPYSAPQGEVYGLYYGLMGVHHHNLLAHPFTIYCDNEMVVRTMNEWGPSRSASQWEDKSYAVEFQNMLKFVADWRKLSTVTIKHIPSHVYPLNDYVDKLAAKYRSL